MSTLQETKDGVVMKVRVVPRASRTELAGCMDDALKIRLQAPPVEGKANKALVKFLAGLLAIPPRDIELLSGETGRTKRILLRGVRQSALERNPALADLAK